MGVDGLLNKSKIAVYIFLCHLFMKSPVQDLKWVMVANKMLKHKINSSDNAINEFFILYKIFLQSSLLNVDEEGNWSQNITQSLAGFFQHCEFFWKAGNNFISLGKIKKDQKIFSVLEWNQREIYRASFIIIFFFQFKESSGK